MTDLKALSEKAEAMIVALRCGDPTTKKCDDASDLLIDLVRDIRTGQLVEMPSVEELVGVIADGHILISDGRYRAFAQAIINHLEGKRG